MVESSKQNKSLFLGVAAATALVGAALLYHYVFSDPDDEDGSSTSIIEELKEANLDKVKKGPSGHMLDPKYMVELLNFVTNTGRKRREGERKAALDNRREAYKSSNWEEYREIVSTQFQKEDQMCQAVMKEVLDVLTETTEQEFQMTMQTMAQNPQYAQMIMAAQQGKLPSEEKMAKAKAQPKLQKQKTLQAFQESKKLTMDAMKKQMTMQQKAQMGGQDEMQMMIDMFVDQAKVEDALFIKTGVTNDELEDSIMYLMGMDDPEMKKEMTSYMMEMQKAMGPGGAGPGGF